MGQQDAGDRVRPLGRWLPSPKAKLADQVREVCRFKHFPRRTEESYVGWVERYVRFCRRADGTWRHPRECGVEEVRAYQRALGG